MVWREEGLQCSGRAGAVDDEVAKEEKGERSEAKDENEKSLRSEEDADTTAKASTAWSKASGRRGNEVEGVQSCQCRLGSMSQCWTVLIVMPVGRVYLLGENKCGTTRDDFRNWYTASTFNFESCAAAVFQVSLFSCT